MAQLSTLVGKLDHSSLDTPSDAPGWDRDSDLWRGQIINKIDYGLHVDRGQLEIVLAGPVLVSGTGTAPTEIECDVTESPLPPQMADVGRSDRCPLLVREGGDLGLQLQDGS